MDKALLSNCLSKAFATSKVWWFESTLGRINIMVELRPQEAHGRRTGRRGQQNFSQARDARSQRAAARHEGKGG